MIRKEEDVKLGIHLIKAITVQISVELRCWEARPGPPLENRKKKRKKKENLFDS